jgi:cyclic pyranopterin phosphate synthase
MHSRVSFITASVDYRCVQLRCTYCLPDGYKPGAVTNKGFLSVDEVRRVTRAFSARAPKSAPDRRRTLCAATLPTSSPPCVKTRDPPDCGHHQRLPLARDVERWRDAGLTAINVSVDSLDARQFHAITGQDKFHQVMDGIDAALPLALTR